MATFKRLSSGKWQAQVARRGVRKSKSFLTRRAAQDWASQTEFEIQNEGPLECRATLGDAFDRYAREESPKKRGKRWEQIRLQKFCQYRIANMKLSELAARDLALWRDTRLGEVSPSTVNREMTLMSAVLTIARREWGWIAENPLIDVHLPSKPPGRDRRVLDSEVQALLAVAGSNLSTKTARAPCFPICN